MRKTRTLSRLGEVILMIVVAAVTLLFIAPALHHGLFFIYNHISGKCVPV